LGLSAQQKINVVNVVRNTTTHNGDDQSPRGASRDARQTFAGQREINTEQVLINLITGGVATGKSSPTFLW
jgi:hypothetical protein